MTLCLAFDCAGTACSAAVVARAGAGGTNRTLAVRVEATERDHAARLAPMVEDTLRAAGVAGSDLDLIATTVGPGSFTGVRIGLALGRGLSLGWRKPLAGVSTLDALLAAAPCNLHATTVAAIDTKRGDWYARIGADGAPPLLATTAALAERLRGRPTLLVGAALDDLASELRALGIDARSASAGIDPQIVASLALDAGAPAWAARNAAEGRPRPYYLRGADVTLPGGLRTTA